jgi:hypothetical protein
MVQKWRNWSKMTKGAAIVVSGCELTVGVTRLKDRDQRRIGGGRKAVSAA